MNRPDILNIARQHLSDAISNASRQANCRRGVRAIFT